jgi:hypothetical protein
MTPTCRLILNGLREAGSPLTLVGLAARTGAKVSTIEAYGRDLAREGHIVRFKANGQTMFGLPGQIFCAADVPLTIRRRARTGLYVVRRDTRHNVVYTVGGAEPIDTPASQRSAD